MFYLFFIFSTVTRMDEIFFFFLFFYFSYQTERKIIFFIFLVYYPFNFSTFHFPFYSTKQNFNLIHFLQRDQLHVSHHSKNINKIWYNMKYIWIKKYYNNIQKKKKNVKHVLVEWCPLVNFFFLFLWSWKNEYL